jgi:hypothetical protein
VNFPQTIIDFADAFSQLQEHRHKADYDPNAEFQKSDALQWFGLAQTSVANLRASSSVDKRAFAAWVLISSPGARNAREPVLNKKKTD